MSPSFDLSVINRSNELDGDPDELDSLARVFETNADAISNASTSIRKLTMQGNDLESEAFGSLAEKARKIDSGLYQTATRYRSMAQAVRGFSRVLREEQSAANGHLEGARNAYRDERRAATDYATAQVMTRSVDESSRQQGMDLGRSARAQHQAAQSNLRANKAKLNAAIDRVRNANVAASGKVQDAMEQSGLDDTLLDKVVEVGKKALAIAKTVGQWVWDNLETISLVVKVLAVVTAGVPILGAVMGALSTGLLVAVKIKGFIKTGTTIWSVGRDISEGNYSGAAKTALTFGANYVAGKVIGAASKSVSKAAGSAISKQMYSVSADGSLQSTAVGRQIHETVMKYGPKMIADGDPLPADFASMHINRTTKVIEDVVTAGTNKVVKDGLKSVYRPVRDVVVDEVSGWLTPLDRRPYLYETCHIGGSSFGGR